MANDVRTNNCCGSGGSRSGHKYDAPHIRTNRRTGSTGKPDPVRIADGAAEPAGMEIGLRLEIALHWQHEMLSAENSEVAESERFAPLTSVRVLPDQRDCDWNAF